MTADTLTSPNRVRAELKHVTHLVGNPSIRQIALDDVSLQVHAGELLAILGPSGAGKSVLLKLLGALELPTEGSAYLAGQELNSLDKNRRVALRRDEVGFIFSHQNLVDSLTAAENISLVLEISGTDYNTAMQQAGLALARVHASDLIERFPPEISIGGQQRVALARALVGSERIILADEPTARMDSHTGEAFLQLLRDRVGQGSTCVLATHSEKVAAYADRVLLINDGRVGLG